MCYDDWLMNELPDYPEDAWLVWERDTCDVFQILGRLAETCPCSLADCEHKRAARQAAELLRPIERLFGGPAGEEPTRGTPTDVPF